MANSTILYVCTDAGLAIVNKPGTLPEWLPPRRLLAESVVVSAWAEPGPPIRVAVVADGALRVSENGGRSWDDVTPVQSARALWEQKGSDGQHVTLYLAQHGGAISASRDAGASWSQLPEFPSDATRVQFCGYHAGGGTLLVARSARGADMLLLGDPAAGAWRTLLTGEIGSAAYGANGTLYASTADGVVLSVDLGSTWAALAGAPAGGQALGVIPGGANRPATVIIGLESGIMVSPDEGQTWRDSSLPVHGSVTTLARDPERRDRVYAGLSTGYLLESGNRGEKWDLVNSQPLPAISALHVIRI